MEYLFFLNLEFSYILFRVNFNFSLHGLENFSWVDCEANKRSEHYKPLNLEMFDNAVAR